MNQIQKPNSLKLVWLFIFINLLISGTAITISFISQKKIVYVDAIRLVSKYKGMEQARKELEEKSKHWKTNLDTLKYEMDKAIASYEASKKKVSPREEQLLQELAKSKQQQFINYQDVVKEQYQKDDKEKSEQILSKVNEYIKRYGEKHGYPIVLAATNYGNIAYADKGLDITEEVLVGLNEEYSKLK